MCPKQRDDSLNDKKLPMRKGFSQKRHCVFLVSGSYYQQGTQVSKAYHQQGTQVSKATEDPKADGIFLTAFCSSVSVLNT